MDDRIEETGRFHELFRAEAGPSAECALPGALPGLTVKEMAPAVGGSLLVHILVAMTALALSCGRPSRSPEKPFITVNLVGAQGMSGGGGAGTSDRVGPGTEEGGAADRIPPRVGSPQTSPLPGEAISFDGAASAEAEAEAEAQKADINKSAASRAGKDVKRTEPTAREWKRSKKRPSQHGANGMDSRRLPPVDVENTASSLDLDKSAASSAYQNSGMENPQAGPGAGEGHGSQKDVNAEQGTGSGIGSGMASGMGSGTSSHDGSAYGTGSHPARSSPGPPDRMPTVVKRVEPAYPDKARHAGISGRVVLKFLVEADGRISKPSILEAHPEGVFEQSVLAAIRQWRFKPGYHRESAVAAWVILTFQFDTNH